MAIKKKIEEKIEENIEVETKKTLSTFDILDNLIQKQFNEVVDLSKVDGRVKNWYDTGVYALNYSMSKNLKYGIPAGRITSYTGLSGCLFDNTIIKINRGKRTGYREYTIKEIAKKVNGRKWNKKIPLNTFSYKEDTDCISYNEIQEIIDSGDKECFELITETGKSIIVSTDHPFKTLIPNNRGIKEKDGFVALKDLIVGEEIMVKSKIENLIVLSKEEHDKLHSNNKGFRHFGNNEYLYEKIKSILSVGTKHTYDIRMKEPYSNFVANDFVVHNTGKSLLAAAAMKDPQLDIIFLIETEGGGHAKELIEFAGVDSNKVRIIKANTFACYKINKKNSKIEEIADDKFPVTKDTPEFLYVEGATRMIKRFIHALDFTPKLKESKILMILDSLGNLASVRELSGGFDMGARAQDIGGFFRTFDISFEKTNIGFLYTNKLYTNLGNIYDPWKETGGVNVEYNPSLSVRFADTSATDDKTDAEILEEKERRKTSLGSSIKTIRATTTKSRFGTELRNAWFLLDFSVGPVRLSGLFTLLKDFGVITGTKSYSIKGWNDDKPFFKKNFLTIVLQNEEKNINLFQKLLSEVEFNIKKKKSELQINDLSEIPQEHEQDETEDVDSLGNMLMAIEKDEKK